MMSATSTTLSVVLVTDSDSFASFNRGPMTSYFSQPPSCLETLTLNQENRLDLYWGHLGKSFYYDAACYPKPTVPPQELVTGPWDTYYYSPAICPQGWSSAMRFTDSTFLGPSTETLLSVGLETTIVLCCPSYALQSPRYSYRGESGVGHQCTSKVTQNQVLTYVFPTSYGNSIDRGTVSMTTVRSDSMINGDGIPILWQSSDANVLASASAMTPTGTTPIPTTGVQTGSEPSNSTPSNTTRSSDLSTGAKTGIGIGAPLAVIVIVVIGFLLRWRRKNTRSETRAEMDTFKPNQEGPNEMHVEYRQPQELYTQPEAYYSRHELPQPSPR